MKYKDIYSEDFIKNFKDYGNDIENLELKDEFIVDVDELFKVCNIDYHRDQVYIDENKDRYAKAKVLGFKLLGYDKINPIYKKGLKNMIEFKTNKFADELLLPKNLIWGVLKASLIELGLDINHEFDDSDIEIVTKLISEKTKTSYLLVKKRLLDFGTFV